MQIDNRENIRVALQSIKGNRLRSFLTAAIIAIGIMALVGILTAIDGIKTFTEKTFSQMGANSFTIRNRGTGIRFGGNGSAPKRYTPISYNEAVRFKQRFSTSATVSLNLFASFASIAKYKEFKTNPNINILGADENYLQTGGYELDAGRNFSAAEVERGNSMILIGQEVKTRLFKSGDAVDQIINIGGNKFKVIGVLKSKGSSAGMGGDKMCIIPIFKAKQITTNPNPSYTISVVAPNPIAMAPLEGEATALFRNIRNIPVARENNFEITRSDSIQQELSGQMFFMTVAGIVIGLITLIGASIGLMNIMLVSVTERTREIGVRKAIGATPKIIRRQFLTEALMICLMGCAAGILLGMAIGNLIAILIGAGFIVPWAWIMLALVLCTVIGIGSGYYPAKKASKLDPVEALRYE
ncbi:MAG: ABC transporter permease [Mucilaginibacter polytrichastri]|nr:ABC transporter permease [Mucilaginibacter polytrichastri]